MRSRGGTGSKVMRFPSAVQGVTSIFLAAYNKIQREKGKLRELLNIKIAGFGSSPLA